MSDESSRWKKKYFAKLDEMELATGSLSEKIHLLQRLLVRVSLAAEGADRKLDRELANLRGIIRKEDSSNRDLNQQLDVIEKQVLKMDQGRESSVQGVTQALNELADQLLACDLSRNQKKAIKSFGKQVEKEVEDIRAYPGLLGELVKIQKDALAELLLQSGGSEQRETFFSRLFKSSQTDDAVNDSSDDMDESEKETVEYQGSGAAAGVINLSSEPGFSAIEDHVRATLSDLVEQLHLPESMYKEAIIIQENIESGLNWYELVPTLDDIANLVIAAVGKGQKDFEAFLKCLDERIAQIQTFLESNKQFQNESVQNSRNLHQEMKSHVSSMQENVQKVEDIGHLKSAVQSNLDAILDSLESYTSLEEAREEKFEQAYIEMQNRLTELEQKSNVLQQELITQQEKAMTDALTCLPNRMAYENRVQIEYERWKRYGGKLSLVVADIDLFKGINDKYGHLAGDKVIQLIGKEVMKRIRKTDFIARYGGEEFIILLPETGADTAYSVMNKTREMISRMPFHFQNEKVHVTISMGVAEFSEDVTVKDVFERADQALYQAKSEGRNQVMLSKT